MDSENTIKLFDYKKIRVIWEEELEKWFFFVVDIVGVLSESVDPNNYWKVLKNRLKKRAVSWLQIVTN